MIEFQNANIDVCRTISEIFETPACKNSVHDAPDPRALEPGVRGLTSSNRTVFFHLPEFLTFKNANIGPFPLK